NRGDVSRHARLALSGLWAAESSHVDGTRTVEDGSGSVTCETYVDGYTCGYCRATYLQAQVAGRRVDEERVRHERRGAHLVTLAEELQQWVAVGAPVQVVGLCEGRVGVQTLPLHPDHVVAQLEHVGATARVADHALCLAWVREVHAVVEGASTWRRTEVSRSSAQHQELRIGMGARVDVERVDVVRSASDVRTTYLGERRVLDTDVVVDQVPDAFVDFDRGSLLTEVVRTPGDVATEAVVCDDVVRAVEDHPPRS